MYKGLVLVALMDYKAGHRHPVIKAGDLVWVHYLSDGYANVTFAWQSDERFVNNAKVMFNNIGKYFAPADHMKGFQDMSAYLKQFKKGVMVEAITNVKAYKKGERFTINKDQGGVTYSSRTPTVSIEGRGSFACNNLKILTERNTMNVMPNTKFFCVATENAKSSRKYFTGENAEAEANAEIKRLIGEGATGVALLEAKKVVRPKVDVEEITF